MDVDGIRGYFMSSHSSTRDSLFSLQHNFCLLLLNGIISIFFSLNEKKKIFLFLTFPH